MAQDSGATDSVSNEKSHFQTLGLRDDLPSIRDGRGNFTKVLGIGTIVIRAAAEHGDKNVTIRGVLYAPDFVANVVSPRHLKREGFKFLDSAAWTGVVSPTGVRIPLVEHKGLFYWDGIRSTGERGTLNDCNTNVLLNITDKLGSPNETKQSLKKMLNDPTVSKSTTKRTAVRMRLAELCEYTANCPASDELLREHCRRGHASIDVTVKALNQTLTRKEIRKKYGAVAGVFCEACATHKTTKASMDRQPKPKPIHFGDLTYTDVAGKYHTSSVQNKSLFLVCFIDAATSYCTVYGLESLDLIPKAIAQYYAFVDSKTGGSRRERALLREKRRRHESANRCCDALRFSSLLPL